ncbi:MAG: 2-hydroxyacyl-CoA dehydratase family protein [Chloroflexota bacterium]|nr:2-hydroxyacyl-CoA dehydratase family protein [Chloroflexota bacterium]
MNETNDKYQLHRMMYEFVRVSEDPQLKLGAEWLGSVFQAVEEGRPIAYHPFTMFSEVMVALDIQSICCEGWDIIAMTADPQHPIASMDTARDAGIPEDLCSFDKAIIGSVMRETIPPPTMIVLSATPCQNAAITYQAVAELTGAPLWVSDSPYNLNQEGAMDYWVHQYQGLIGFLEQNSGKKMDYDRLREVLEESNRCVEYWLEGMELMKLKPTPWTGPFGVGTFAGITMFGTPSATAAVKAVHDQIKDRVNRGETAIPEEKLRAIFFHLMPSWDQALVFWLGQQGVAIPFMVFDDYRVEPVDTSTPESMVKGMARRALNTPMGKLGRGAFNEYINDMLYAIAEWKGDCVVICAHPGCKWMTGGYSLIKDACHKRDIPLLVYDIDLADPRITSAEESRSILSDFVATIVDRTA